MTLTREPSLKIAEFFDRAYATYDRYWWRGEHRYALNPEEHDGITARLLALLQSRPPGVALDVGAGEGADAIRLALLGYQVDAVELSRVGADKIRRFAQEKGVQVNVYNMDARDFNPVQKYDLILCNGLLHYVEDKQPLLTRIMSATQVGGLNVVSVFTDYTPVPEVHRVIPVYCDREDGVVKAAYRNWKFHLFWLERNKPHTTHPDFPPHQHSLLKIIAEKPVE